VYFLFLPVRWVRLDLVVIVPSRNPELPASFFSDRLTHPARSNLIPQFPQPCSQLSCRLFCVLPLAWITRSKVITLTQVASRVHVTSSLYLSVGATSWGRAPILVGFFIFHDLSPMFSRKCPWLGPFLHTRVSHCHQHR